jgi:hypothetical protein
MIIFLCDKAGSLRERSDTGIAPLRAGKWPMTLIYQLDQPDRAQGEDAACDQEQGGDRVSCGGEGEMAAGILTREDRG